jgi:hypothetical protein
MDGVQLRDQAVQDRIRAAAEFLDPRTIAMRLLHMMLLRD